MKRDFNYTTAVSDYRLEEEICKTLCRLSDKHKDFKVESIIHRVLHGLLFIIHI